MLRITLAVLLLSLLLAACNEESQTIDEDKICNEDADCVSGMVCDNGVCRNESTADCDENDVDCDGSWARVCQNGGWIRTTDCANLDKICQDGECRSEAADCTDNDVECDGNWVRLCQDGTWVRNMDCSNLDKICRDGECRTQENDEDGDIEDEEPPQSDGDDVEDLCDCGPDNSDCCDGCHVLEGSCTPEDANAVAGTCDGEICLIDGCLNGYDVSLDRLSCTEATQPDGDEPDGDEPDGDEPDGDEPDGDEPDGDEPDGDGPDGDEPDGDEPDGDEPDGDGPDGDDSDGDADEELVFCTTEPCCQGGLWLTENSPCSTGNSIPACTNEQCSASHECLPTVIGNYCLLDGQCYQGGQINPENPCQMCDTTLNAWMAYNEGQVCNDDGNACNGVSTCQQGICVARTPAVTCQASDECHLVGNCDPQTGLCSQPLQVDGTLCGTSDQCYQGVCVDCLNNAGCQDLADDGLECSAKACDTLTHLCYHDLDAYVGQPCGSSTDSECDNPDTCNAQGICQTNYEASSTLCNDDGDACNGVSTCQQGRCLVSTPVVVCQASNECHQVGTCDPSSGLCSNPMKENGSSCGTSDQCYQGQCVDCLSDAACSDLADDGLECTEVVCNLDTHLCEHNPSARVGEICGDAPSNECYQASTCNTLGTCQVNAKPTGTLCNDDGNLCNGVSACNEGVCSQSTAPVVCPAPGECQLAGICNPTTGSCSYSNKADGTSCSSGEGFCYHGQCVECVMDSQCAGLPDDGLECTVPVCDPETHICVQDPSPHAGDLCGDGTENDCNKPDTCDANGICQPNYEPAATSCDGGNNSVCISGGACDGLGSCQDGIVCSGHGTCGSTGCSCSAGYKGDFCEFWTKSFGASGYDSVKDTALDSQGNIYLTGYFSNTVSFGSTSLTSNGGYDIFLAKLRPDGSPLWAKRFGGTSDDIGYGVAVDSEDNVIFTGYFQGTINLNGDLVPSAGGTDIVIVKFSADGDYISGKRFGSSSSDVGSDVTVDSQDNLLLTGHFAGTADFGGDETRTSKGNYDIFLLKLTPDGETSWVWTAGGTSEDNGYAVAVDTQDNIAVTGYFAGTATFGSENLTSAGSYDIFVSKLDAEGNNLWNKRYGGTAGSEYGNSCTFDSVGDVIVAGKNSQDPILFKYTGDGRVLLWSKVFGSNSGYSSYASKVLVDSQDRIVITGKAVSTSFAANNSYSGGFLARFLIDGTFDWAKAFGSSNYTFPTSMAWDAKENIVWVGAYSSSTLTINNISVSNAGSDDMFVAHLPIGN